MEAEWTVVPGDHLDLRTGWFEDDVEIVLSCSRNLLARVFQVESELDMIVVRS